jgi:DNA-binding transcriptional MerR regulator
MNETWSIGEVAKLFSVSTDTLRYYEKMGLLASHKNPENGYRYYSYDEIVVLMDILFFRNMELSIQDIKQMITKMDVGDIKNILYQNQKLVEYRIQELKKLQTMITQVASQYKSCEERLGQFLVVTAPSFKYKLMSHQEDDLVSMIREYKKEDWIDDRIRYMLVVDETDLVENANFCLAHVGFSIEKENFSMLPSWEAKNFSSLPEAEYLYTILGTTYIEAKNDILQKALQYIQELGREVGGSLVGRYMASSHKDGLDYYELWIALAKT